jgi:hypothetical protein
MLRNTVLTDTAGDSEQRWNECFRGMSRNEKWLILNDMFKAAKILHAGGVRLRIPHASDAIIRREWLRAAVGSELYSQAITGKHDAVG